jgi:hypothetical protein
VRLFRHEIGYTMVLVVELDHVSHATGSTRNNNLKRYRICPVRRPNIKRSPARLFKYPAIIEAFLAFRMVSACNSSATCSWCTTRECDPCYLIQIVPSPKAVHKMPKAVYE